MRPFRLLESVPSDEQLDGIDGTRGSPMIWIGTPATVAFGTLEAVSPGWPPLGCVNSMVASETDPQVTPNRNWLHCAIGLLFESTCSGKPVGFNCPPGVPCASKRSPIEPVSTSTWSMVWQFEVPGTQTVTVTNAPFV